MDPKFDVAGSGGYTNSFVTTVSGTVTPYSGPGVGPPVQLIVDGQLQGAPAMQSGFGTWSSLAGLHPGANTVAAVETVGGVQQVSRTVTYDVVLQPPTVAFTTGLQSVDRAQQTVTGTATSVAGPGAVAGRALTLADDGTPVAQATVAADGTWSAPVTLAHLGLNRLTATLMDAAGNTGSGEAHWTYTATPPAVSITSAGGAVTQAQQAVGGLASPGDAIRLLDNGAAVDAFTVNASGIWLRNETLAGLGTHAIQAVDTSPAGNTGASNTVVYTLGAPQNAAPIDTIGAPSVSVITVGGLAGGLAGGLTRQPALAVSGLATPQSIVALFDGGAPVSHTVAAADGRWSLGVTLAEGPNVLTATDYAPSGTASAAPIMVTLDTTPPTVGFDTAPQLAGSAAILTGTASDANGVRGVEIFDGATDLGAAKLTGDAWSFTRDFISGTADHLTAVATDAAGNAAAAAAPYALDAAPAGRRSIGTVTRFDAAGGVASVMTVGADGAVGAETVSNGDGTATGTGYENGQALISIGGDVMTGNGYGETFVFGSAMGDARVTDFVVGGAGHDTLALSRADFGSVAEVLRSTTMDGGDAVIHVSPDDTIRLDGVTKAQLVHHRGDISFLG